jgi:hypothetical protein
MAQDALESDFAALVYTGDLYLDTEPGNPFPIPGWRANISRLALLSNAFSQHRALFSPLTVDIRQRAIVREIGIIQIMIDDWTEFAEVIRHKPTVRNRLVRLRKAVEKTVGPL